MVSEKIIGEGKSGRQREETEVVAQLKWMGWEKMGDREKNSMAPPTGKEKNLGEGAKECEGSHEVSVSPIYSG